MCCRRCLGREWPEPETNVLVMLFKQLLTTCVRDVRQVFDAASGRHYEYNKFTNETRWLATAPPPPPPL
jgi:hypothetical protein